MAMDHVYLLIAVVVILGGLDQLVVLVGQSQAVSLPRRLVIAFHSFLLQFI